MKHAKKILTLIAAMSLLCASAFGGVKFNHPFNPLANKVNELEKPARDEICLNGSWDFMPVFSNKKEDFKVPEEFKADSVKIKIPSPWNVNRFASNNVKGGDFNAFPSYPENWKNAKIGWQKRSFEIPQSWSGKRVILRFDGVMGNCEVYVNGAKAAENFDMFMPFEADITDFVKIGGKNEILVGVAKAELYNKQGKFGRIEYMGGSFWGEHVSGIWQDVYLLAKPEVYISDVFVRPNVKNSTLALDIEIKNTTKAPKKISVGGNVRKWKNLAGTSVEEAPVEKGAYEKSPALLLGATQVEVPANSSKTLTIEVKNVSQLDFWTPETPNLYGAVISAGKDVKVQRFGWRQFTIEGKELFLNGKKYMLKGDSWHFMGVPQMTRRYAWSLFKMMKDANINAVRFHAQPYPEFYMDVADEFGVCVLDESAIWASGGAPKYDSDLYMQRAKEHVERFVKRDRNHPSVFGWSVCNEVLAVAIHVFKSPEELVDRVIENMNGWIDVCRTLDPTRDWISGDGETNRPQKTKFPTAMGHYANIDHMSKQSLPWGIGEQTMAYYGTPLQASKYNGNRAYESMLGRMEAIAIETYRDLTEQRNKGAAYACVFNIAWYGLKPLPFGLKDTSKAPTLEDGVFFPEFKEGAYGMQPERLGPYTSTLNPAYDKSMPLYEPWPMFYAAKAANADPIEPFEIKYPEPEKDAEPLKPAAAVELIANENSPLAIQLRAAGLETKKAKNYKNSLIIVDGLKKIENFDEVKKAAKNNAHIVVLGICEESAEQLNSILGKNKIELEKRKATSFIKKANSPMLSGLNHKDIYFSELVNNDTSLMEYGLAGEFAKNAELIAEACNTDWQQWNKRAEYAKTGAVIRSEREAKGSGNAIMSLKNKKGAEIIVSTINFAPIANESSALISKMLSNLGATFSESKADEVRALGEDGSLNRVVTSEDGKVKTAKNGKIDLPSSCREFSFWVYSPRSLVDLLAEPNMPVLDMVSQNKVELKLNGKDMAERSKDGKTFTVLPLDKGWNKFTLKTDGARNVKIHFECKNQPKFMKELLSSIENRRN